MADSIKIKTARDADGIEVRVLINHPMSIGRLDQASGKYLNAHYIEEVVVALNGKPVVQGDWSSGVARNPYLMFRVRGTTPGDRLQLSWKDNRGGADSYETTLA